MIEKIIEACARQKLLVLIFTVVMISASFWSVKHIPLDAIPDLSDTQVIIYSRWDRSPDIIEDQVTYPIVSALLGAPQVKAIRGFSDFGFSYVYVIFKDGTDLYWARSRVLEYLSKISSNLPEGVKTELGPDATGLGWVLQYVLVDKSGEHDLSELRSFQDWHLRYMLQSVPGVSEVASLGGFVKQYQITVDPRKLLAYKIPITKVIEAVRQGNKESGGRLVEFTGAEYMIRGHGYAKSIGDLEQIVLGADDKGVPILIKDLGSVSLGGEIRRGVQDLNGEGDVVGGTIVMRQGENALRVIDAVKARLKEVELPKGVTIDMTYDRSDVILKAIDYLKKQLTEEMIIVSLVILLFLWHFPSAFIPILTIPLAVFIAFIPLYGMKLTSNIMSLAGIAISIGVLVDGAIVQMENVYKRLEEWEHRGRQENAHDVVLNAIKEVAPSVFFSLLVIAVSFLPIFTLVDQEGRLFKPLAWSKTFAMTIAAILVVTLNPVLRLMFVRTKPITKGPQWFRFAANALTMGRYYPEEKHPISRILFRMYEPICRWVLSHAKTTIVIGLLLMASVVPIFLKLGSEFMPPLWEGQILYMPTTMPGISIAEASKLLQTQDKILKSFPEVEKVFGKAGRMESSTDPAPFNMMETVVLLKPEQQWRTVNGRRITHDELIEEMDEGLKIPGTTNSWTMPIKNRIDMLSTGIRTPIGIKVLGGDFAEIEKIGVELETLLKDVPGTRSVFAERTQGGFFLDFDIKRDQLARYQLSVSDAQMAIESAIGGENITTTVEGRERYNISVRYPRELRNDIDTLSRVLIATPSGAQVPIGEIAQLVMRTGPSMIRNENGLLAGYVYVDVAGRDIGSYVKDAKKKVSNSLKLTPGYSLLWSGQYENMLRVKERLKIVLPFTLLTIALLLYFNTKSWVKTGIVLLAVPFSLVGAFWLLWILKYNLSIAVWVGMIALMGLDAETGVLMLLFLDLAYKDAAKRNQMQSQNDLKEAIVHGAVRRIRPKMMTVMAAFMGLIPIMWSTGIGADVMKRIAAPMIGGLTSSFALELLIYPAIYFIWKSRIMKTVKFRFFKLRQEK
jgi:Cu(I)/Ag(I) efflux system membrane protein CusA/SilA